jgi:hypothetical protein
MSGGNKKLPKAKTNTFNYTLTAALSQEQPFFYPCAQGVAPEAGIC